jgi:hypothetical protein
MGIGHTIEVVEPRSDQRDLVLAALFHFGGLL